MQASYPPIRRIVTGHDQARVAKALIDAPATNEYPRFRHHAIAADRDAINVIGDQFEPGMVFAFNIDLLNPKWRHGQTGCVFAETIEITKTGVRRMHTFPLEFQRVN